MMKRILAHLLALTLLAISSWAAAPTPPATTTKPASMPAAEVTTDAATMGKDYGADEKAADGKYKGKVVEISGFVVMPGSPVNGSAMAPGPNFCVIGETKDANAFGGGSMIRCYVATVDNGRCNALGQGQPITLRGKCDGKNKDMAMFIDLKDCGIVKLGDDPTPSLTAEELAAAYAKDAKAAGQKFGAPTMIIVKGKVTKLDKENFTVWMDAGKGADGKAVSVHFTVSSLVWDDAEKHAVGTAIAIKGETTGELKDGVLEAMFGLVLP